MKRIDPTDVSIPEVHHLLLGGVAPRPIALVSTVSAEGNNNLSPFSFYNAFGANPPVLVFSPSRRGRDGSTKDTLNNLEATGECVVQAVTYEIVQQVSLASTEYPPETDEFIKSGLTPVASEFVKPMRVQESPFQMECRVRQILPIGESKASANLVICDVLLFHVEENLFTGSIIDPQKIKLVGRNSGSYYTSAFNDAIFEVPKPIGNTGIGFDRLPDYIRNSKVLTGNNLAQLANSETIPDNDTISTFIRQYTIDSSAIGELTTLVSSGDYKNLLAAGLALKVTDPDKAAEIIHISAKTALDKADDSEFAWLALLAINFEVE